MVRKKVKVILYQTINPAMETGDIIEVSYGYARNYLLPNKFASLATKSSLKISHRNQRIQTQKAFEEHNQLNIVKKYLERIQRFSIRKKISGRYKFFGSITVKDISKLIWNSTGVIINKKQIVLSQIREVGFYVIQIKLLQNIVVSISAQILPIFAEINID